MADSEIPEVRAELQREDTPPAKPRSLGAVGWLVWALTAILIISVIAAFSLR